MEKYMKKYLLFILLFLPTFVSGQIFYQTYKVHYDSFTHKSSWTWVGTFRIGTDTSTWNTVILDTGSIKTEEIVADKEVITPRIDFSIRYDTNTAPSSANLLVISSRTWSLWVSTGTGTKAWRKIGGQ